MAGWAGLAGRVVDEDEGMLVAFVPLAIAPITDPAKIRTKTARIPAVILCLRHQGRFAGGGDAGDPCTGGVGGRV